MFASVKEHLSPPYIDEIIDLIDPTRVIIACQFEIVLVENGRLLLNNEG